MFTKFRNWHIKKLDQFQKITGFSNYQMLWVMFFEGLFFGFLVGYFIF